MIESYLFCFTETNNIRYWFLTIDSYMSQAHFCYPWNRRNTFYPIVGFEEKGEADYSKPGGHILNGEADYSKPGGHILDALLDICDMPAGAWAGGRRHKIIKIFSIYKIFWFICSGFFGVHVPNNLLSLDFKFNSEQNSSAFNFGNSGVYGGWSRTRGVFSSCQCHCFLCLPASVIFWGRRENISDVEWEA